MKNKEMLQGDFFFKKCIPVMHCDNAFVYRLFACENLTLENRSRMSSFKTLHLQVLFDRIFKSTWMGLISV